MQENGSYFTPYTRINLNQAWYHTLIISAFGRCRQDDLTFKLGDTVSSKPTCTTFDPASKKKKKVRPGGGDPKL